MFTATSSKQMIKCDSRYKPENGTAVFYVHEISVGRDSSVGIAIPHGLHGLGIESRWTDFPHPSKPPLRPIKLPLQWAQGLFPGGIATDGWRSPHTLIKCRGLRKHTARRLMSCSRVNFTITFIYPIGHGPDEKLRSITVSIYGYFCLTSYLYLKIGA